MNRVKIKQIAPFTVAQLSGKFTDGSIATAASANAIPRADGTGKLAAGWLAGVPPSYVQGSFAGGETAGVFNTTTSYARRGLLIFRGTNIMGTPSAIKAILWVLTDGLAGAIRIWDLTNNLQIAEKTNVTNGDLEILSLGTLANLPAAEAIWELALKGTETTIYCGGLKIE